MNQSMKKVLPFMNRYRVAFGCALLFGITATVLNLAVPNLVKKITEMISEGLDSAIPVNAVITQALICAAVIIIAYILNMIYYKQMIRYGRYIGRDLNETLNEKINRISLLKMETLSSGDLIARSTVDIENISSFLSKTLGAIILGLLQCLGALTLMMITSVPLGLCCGAAGLLGSFLIRKLSKKTRILMARQREKLSFINAQIDESLSGFTVIKAFNAEEDVLRTFNENNDLMAEHMCRARMIAGLLAPCMTFLNNFSYIMICLLAAYFMLGKSPVMSISLLITFIMYAKLFASPISTIAGTIGELEMAKVSAGKIMDIFELAEDEDKGKKNLLKAKGEVTFENVRFGYQTECQIIHGFSAEVKPGTKVAIVGPTGAGKSTLVNLLMRFYEINEGKILIDKTDIREIPRKQLHERLGMVLQDSFLFSGSLRDNIIYASGQISDENLSQVIEKCGLDYLIKTLPDGADTLLNAASNVSQGQKQLIAIARTMIRDPDILILDEATSSIDTRTEKLIQNALDTLMEGRTSFVIAHRLSTIENADLIFVLKDGDIKECGKHEELLQKGGLYAELYQSQFEGQ